jgi:hypothetical protein
MRKKRRSRPTSKPQSFMVGFPWDMGGGGGREVVDTAFAQMNERPNITLWRESAPNARRLKWRS